LTCPEPPLDCIVQHIAPALGLRATSATQWDGRAKCPSCGGNFRLHLKGSRIEFCCMRSPRCTPEQIKAAMPERLIQFGCIQLAKRSRADTVARSDLEQLLGLSGAALRLRIACLAWDCSPREAAAKLGMPERTYRLAVTSLPK
jgi:hypothetical protein